MPNQQIVQQVIDALQQMSTASGIYNSRVADRVGVDPTDLDLVELLSRHGPTSPGLLTAQHGLPAAHVYNGVNRLTKAGYVSSQGGNLAADQAKLSSDIVPHYQPAVQATHQLCQQYTDEQLSTIVDFFTKSIAQGYELFQQG